MEIRSAQLADVDRLQVLLSQLGYEVSSQDIKRMVPQSLGSSIDDVYVAVCNKEVVGLISLIYFNYFPSAQKLCRITAVVVDESLRGSGVGTKLIGFAKQKAITENCSTIEVTTSLARDKTQSYYEVIGFQKKSFGYAQQLNKSV